ncbi:MAG TPA: FAD-binding protein [Rhodothermales bacterium]|nr:FAD-binding protein [Rhodothermales bacterium]
MSSEIATSVRSNWAGNFTYSTQRLHLPRTVGEAQEIVRSAAHIRPLGSRHCFNAIADSRERQISLRNLNQIVNLDEKLRRVTVEAGIRYGDLCPFLHERGYALHNLASLPHINIVGACATATHGSGVTSGNLATAVAAIELIKADGELVALSRDGEDMGFGGAVVALGGLGVVTRFTLEIQPAFDMTQHVYLNLPPAALDDHLEEILSSGYSVSLFTDWQSDTVNQIWIKRKIAVDHTLPRLVPATVEAEPEFFGARLATRNMHPIPGHAAVNCTQQVGVPGPSYERLPHFRMEFTPSSGRELQSEYFVRREYSRDVIRVLRSFGDQLAPLLMISEIRTVDADDLWISPCYDRPSTGFHFTWKQDWSALKDLLPLIEEALEPYEAVPHWGKLFTMSARRIQSRYERLPDFRALLQEYDPDGKFRNPFLEEYIFGEVGAA